MEMLEYIDDYFTGKLPAGEKARFEQQIVNEPEFAAQVAFYVSSKKTAKDLSAEEKRNRFRELYQNNRTETHQPAKVRKIWPYIAAAAMAAAVVIGILLFNKTGINGLTDQYMQNHLQTLAVTMGSREDAMQSGLRLYNEGNATAALVQFGQLAKNDPTNADAKKYAGIACLKLKDYDQALNWFGQLEKEKDLYSNYGTFYHALTLIKRGRDTDKALARQLLQQVVDQGLEGKEDAATWLKNW